MPSAVSPERTDMAATGASFSYAQAAKGRSASQSAGPGSIKSNSDESESAPKMEQTNGNVTDLKQSAIAQATQVDESVNSVDSLPSGTDAQTSVTSSEQSTSKDSGSAEPESVATAAASADAVESTQSNGASASSHERRGDVSSAKDEETSVTANDLDSTWEKVSQTSHAEDKQTNKSEGDVDDSKLTTWEHVPQPAPLKEAPPPSVNIWQKRQADFQSKTKETKPGQKAEAGPGPQTQSSLESSTTAKTEHSKKPFVDRTPKEDRAAEGRTNEGKGRSVNDEAVSRGAKNPGALKSSAGPPPPPSDATSWPTPDLAKDDEKKKPQERLDKAETEKTPSKPHGKEKWVAMPYVPSAVFSTPLPTSNRRGGRPRGGREGGGRGGNHAVNGSISGERNASGLATPSGTGAAGPTERTRGDMGPPPKPGQFPAKSKRASSAGPSSTREQRRNGEVAVDEAVHRSAPRNTGLDSRRVSSSTQTDGARQGSPPSRRQQDYNKDERSQSAYSGRRDGGRNGEFSRESGTMPAGRDRTEGRPERGRGGYRGRGGHNGFGSHVFNGQTMPPGYGGQAYQGFPSSKSQSYSEQRFASQPQTPSFGPREGKHYRNGSRSQSIPNPPAYGRYPSNGGMPGQHGLPHLQTDAANVFYQPPAVMSAMPFNMAVEQSQIANMIQIQMEYYFSLENLIRDTFLRKHMDSQGFVLLSVILNFNRIKQLSNDPELVRFACWRSEFVDFQQGVEDGKDRVRSIRDWQQWVLPTQERNPEAQHDGPQHLQTPQLQYAPNGMFPGHMGPMGAMSPVNFGGPPFSPEHGAANGRHAMPPMNGEGAITQTPLSAAVPDFTPSMPSVLPSHTQSPVHAGAEGTFPDEQINSLTIVVKKEQDDASAQKAPPAATRTFSNGSIDPHAISNDVSGLGPADQSTGVPTTNGDQAPESRSKNVSARSRSPFASHVSSRQSSDNVPPPVFWVKGKDSPIEGLPQNLVAESYLTFREKALAQRQTTSSRLSNFDMDVLYQFWSHFLIRNFNASMYEEFHRFALEDDQSGVTAVGIENLVAFYDASILGQKPLSDNIAYDFVELVKSDHHTGKKERVSFQKLRSALRNGALPLRNRVKVDKLLSSELRAELDS